MINDDSQIADVWSLFAAYIDKKRLALVAEHYVDFVSAQGLEDDIIKSAKGVDKFLDHAIDEFFSHADEEDYEDE